ncbi:hypothetical protein [Sphingomonas sp.]|uniref:hypothetical protein n=1 Tax=Sphingomonas sp. TaxID=28214 RepID=UPI003751187C
MKCPVLLVAMLLPLVGACSAPKISPPSLAPRAAEAIDPRLPVERALVERRLSGSVTARIADYLAAARAGEAAFRAMLGPAQRAAAAAGPAQSESWISAQQSLSALEAARAATPMALSDIDALAAAAVKASGGIGTSELAAIQAAAREAAAIDQAQRREIDALNARIGS